MFKLFIVTVLLIPCLLFSQTEKKFDPDKLGLNVLAGISTFYLNGDLKVFESPFAVGIQYTSAKNRVDAGIYFAPVVNESKDASNSNLSIMPFITIYKSFGIGCGYSFWKSGEGIVKPKKENVFLSFNFSLLQ